MKPLFRETEDKRYLEVIGHYDNPILCAKLTLLADMFAIEHKEGYAKFRIEDENKLSFIDKRVEFGDVGGDVDLTGTTWVINDEPSLTSRTAFSINFASNSTSYSGFGVNAYPSGLDEPILGDVLIYGDGTTYGVTVLEVTPGIPSSTYSWSNNAYKTITITGGTDATNPDLLVWLTNNATQIQQITDLTNTKWLIDDNPSLYDDNTYALNFTSNNNNYDEFSISFPGGSYSYLIYGSDRVLQFYEGTGTYSWLDNAYKTISITGGDDVTSSSLISWLYENATQIIEPTGNSYEVTHSLTNLTHGNISFTIVPDSGYALPSTSESITVTNGTLVSYDSSTGVIVVSGDDTTTISVECLANTGLNNIHIKKVHNEAVAGYKLNDGELVTLTYNTEVVLNGVEKLEIYIDNYAEAPEAQRICIDSSGFVTAGGDIANLNLDSDDHDTWLDITEYLQNGCYVSVYPLD